MSGLGVNVGIVTGEKMGYAFSHEFYFLKSNTKKGVSQSGEKDTIDMVQLHASLVAMAENLAFQLRRGNKLTSNISVKIRYCNFHTYTKQEKIPYTSADHIIIPKIVELFKQLYNRRLLIQLIGVKFTGLELINSCRLYDIE